MNQNDAHRLAAAVNQLRPEWPLASLSAFIHKNLIARAYRDAAVALTWVACDPESLTPARVLENGPWWKAAQAQVGTVSAISQHCPVKGHEQYPAWNCERCADEVITDPEAVAAELAKVRAAIADRPRTPTDHSEPIPARAERADRSKA